MQEQVIILIFYDIGWLLPLKVTEKSQKEFKFEESITDIVDHVLFVSKGL